jgi:hypothetical protein
MQDQPEHGCLDVIAARSGSAGASQPRLSAGYCTVQWCVSFDIHGSCMVMLECTAYGNPWPGSQVSVKCSSAVQGLLMKGGIDCCDSRCNIFVRQRAVCHNREVEGNRQRPRPRLAEALQRYKWCEGKGLLPSADC